MKIIKQTYHIKASTAKVWEALVNPNIIKEWSGSDAKMNDKVGTHFELWDNSINGTNIEVKKGKKLVQEWYGGKWEKPSIVTFTLREDKDGTKIDLHQQGVPPDEVDDIDEGWKKYYLGEIKKLLEQ